MPEDKTANRRIIEANVDCIDEAKAIARQDPFAINGVAKYDFLEFNPVKWDGRFAYFMDQ